MTQPRKSLNVLLIGDVCIDEYHHLSPGKKNPESNSPLYKLDAVVSSYGMVGNVEKCLNNLGIVPKKVLKPPYPWSVKTRYMVDGTQVMRVDQDWTSPEVDLKDVNFSEFDCVVISDYNKGFISDNTIVSIINNSSFKGPIFLDTKKHNLALFEGCIIKTNLLETASATSYPVDGHITTMGGGGAVYRGVHHPALLCKVVDVCGAGDSFLSGLVYGYSCGYTFLSPMITYGICAAGISVQHQGCYQPTEQELLKALEEYNDQVARTS